MIMKRISKIKYNYDNNSSATKHFRSLSRPTVVPFRYSKILLMWEMIQPYISARVNL